jgi:hypothetical protein
MVDYYIYIGNKMTTTASKTVLIDGSFLFLFIPSATNTGEIFKNDLDA